MRYALDPDRSVLEIHASSSLHPIVSSTVATGWIELTLTADGRLDPAGPLDGRVEVDLGTLRAGNPLLDREAERRLRVRRFPTATATLTALEAAEGPGAFTGTGELSLHGVTGLLTGTLHVEPVADGVLLEGTARLDVTDFDIQPPSLLLLKVRPDIRVDLRATAVPDPGPT